MCECDVEEGLKKLIDSLLESESYDIVDQILDKINVEEMMLTYSLAVWRSVVNETKLENKNSFLQKLEFRVSSDGMKLEDYI